jgi:peptidase E
MNILATSGGFRPGRRTRLVPGPLIEHAFKLAGSPARPRFCFLGTAGGDNPLYVAAVYEAFVGRDVAVSHLSAFPMPTVEDVRGHLLAQDVVWVGGGSVAGLLAMWRLHGWDDIFREVWEAGVVLGGVSAGSLCWHIGGTTDSFGTTLRPVTNGLGLIPHSNGVHYDSEEQRRPLYHRLVSEGVLPAGYATDDGVGLHYRGTELVEAVSDTAGKAAYWVERGPDGTAVETKIEPTMLGPG